jgi:glycosyltransferase involved in cell wall biosynthesis
LAKFYCGFRERNSKGKCGAAYSLIEEGENGYIVDVDNPEQLIEKINLLFGNKLNVMKMNSINKAQKYTIEQMVHDHMALFNRFP